MLSLTILAIELVALSLFVGVVFEWLWKLSAGCVQKAGDLLNRKK